MRKSNENVDDFLTVRDLAKWIKLSESHIYFLVNKNKIPFAKLGGKLLFDKDKIRKWIEQNSTNAPKPPKKRKVSDVILNGELTPLSGSAVSSGGTISAGVGNGCIITDNSIKEM